MAKPTNATITIQLSTIAKEVDKANKKIDELTEKVEELSLNNNGYGYKIKSVEEKVSNLEDNQKWVTRLIIGAVIVAILAVIGLVR